jgi:hypothetical protein
MTTFHWNLIYVWLLVPLLTESFLVVPKLGSHSSMTTMHATTRREALLFGTSTLFGVTFWNKIEPADATYSAYSAREKDWEERLAKGEIKISTSRSLRKQLQELVPENSDSRSKVFCPNGTPSNVSPLMENKCADTLLALPSVYGRTEDAVGNSIPGGFTGGELSSLTAATGGFPKY